MRLIGSKVKLDFLEHFYLRVSRESAGMEIPRLLGYAYRDFVTDSNIFIIVPFNVLVASARWLHWRLAITWPEALEHPFRRIYYLGQKDGYSMGRYNKDVVRGAMEILRGEEIDVVSRNDPGA